MTKLLPVIQAEKDNDKRKELVAALTAEELNSLKVEIREAAGTIGDDDTLENIAALTEIADIGDLVTERSTQLTAEKEAATAQAKAARDRINAITPDDEEDDEPVVKAVEPEDEEDDDEDAAKTELELVAAGKKELRSNPAKMKALSKGAKISPELVGTKGARASLVAVGQLENHSNGDSIDSRYDLAEEMAFKLEGMDPSTAPIGKTLVARARWADLYPESRTLSGKSTTEDFKKLDAVTSAQALAASGGVCLPTDVDYSLDVWATEDRPIRDGLASFLIKRGGLVYRQPNTIGSLSGATTIWTEATDASPGEATKGIATIACESPVQAYVAAVVSRLGFGNLQGQFDPETIASNTDLAMAAAARVAELKLWTDIQGFATATITSAKLLGASRDLFSTLIQACGAFRFTNRLKRDQVLTVIFPGWGMDLIKQDRVLELAHDGQSTNVFAITDEEVNSWFTNNNVKVIWTLDGLTANAGAGTYAAQTFAAFTASAVVPVYPANVMWNIFIEGSIQFLDGGRLGLGVVRDSLLDATNDYETFVETFEAVANRGFAGGVLQLVSTTHAIGASSATVTVS